MHSTNQYHTQEQSCTSARVELDRIYCCSAFWYNLNTDFIVYHFYLYCHVLMAKILHIMCIYEGFDSDYITIISQLYHDNNSFYCTFFKISFASCSKAWRERERENN